MLVNVGKVKTCSVWVFRGSHPGLEQEVGYLFAEAQDFCESGADLVLGNVLAVVVDESVVC